MTISNGDCSVFVTRLLSATLLVLALLVLVGPWLLAAGRRVAKGAG